MLVFLLGRVIDWCFDTPFRYTVVGGESHISWLQGNDADDWANQGEFIFSQFRRSLPLLIHPMFEHDRILHGGPRFYKNTMLNLGGFNGVSPVVEFPLNSVKTWDRHMVYQLL